jgi:hypothetical protein
MPGGTAAGGKAAPAGNKAAAPRMAAAAMAAVPAPEEPKCRRDRNGGGGPTAERRASRRRQDEPTSFALHRKVWKVRIPPQCCDQSFPEYYEFVAIRSERLPTITDAVRRLPLVARVAVIAVVVVALVDHFGPGFVL